MQFIRTLFWVALLVVFVILTVLNWDIMVGMEIWPGLIWDTRLPAIVIAAFLLGLVPTWLLHRGTRWRLNRRIGHLETAARASSAARTTEGSPPPPLADNPVEPIR